MQKWTPRIRGQLNDLPGFPARPNTSPPADDRWELGEWIDECHVRPEVLNAAALPLVDNELGDLRFALAEQTWYLWDGAAWVGMNATPSGPAGGDLSGTYPNPLVVGLQGRSVPNLAPSQGQVLQWTGTEWVPGTVPSGGSGGGGITYFLNQNTPADAPTTGLTAPTVKELGLIADGAQTTATKLNVTTVGYDQVAGFVTDLNVPGATSIPAGLWGFNVWASTTAAGATKCSLRTRLYKYDGTTATLVSTAEPVLLFNGSTLTQYTITLVVPPTVLLVTDRLYVVVEATAVGGAGVNVTTYFGDGTPSHVLSTIPAVQGTGVIHVINGVVQSPATPVILTADVSGVLPVANGGTALSTVPTNGQLLIGNGTGYALNTLTPGTGISVTNGAGSITIGNTGVLTVGATAPIASSGGQNPVISLNASGVVAGSYGTASAVPTLSVTTEGLISAAVNTPIQIAESQVTNLVADLAAASLFGSSFDENSTRIGPQDTSAPAPTVKCQLNTGALVSGAKYRVGWKVVVGNNAQLGYWDLFESGAPPSQLDEQAYQSTTVNARAPLGGFVYFTAPTNAARNFQIRVRSAVAGQTMSTYAVNIEFWRVA